MEIKDNGFYDLREIEDNKIIVSSGVQANFFDSKKDRIIILNENSNIGYYNLVIDKKTNIKIFHTGNKSKSEVSCLLISNDKINGELNISVDIKNSNCYSKLHILSIVNNYGNINIDGIIKVEKGLVNNNCNLIEENLFIGKKGNIKASPQLLIKSNDIKASHSCNIDRVDEQLLYYLSTRGIQINKGIKLILESKIKYLFKKIINDQSILIEEKFDDLLLNLV